MEKSGAVLSYGENLTLIAESESRTRKMKIGPGDIASMGQDFEACSV